MARGATGGPAAEGGGEAPSKRRARYCMMGLMALSAAGMLTAVLLYLFPDTPPVIALTDKDALHRAFFSGAPHFLLCASDATNAHVQRVFEAAHPFLRAEGVATGIIDCASPLPASGKTVAQRFHINVNSRPSWFLVHGGQRPTQISPNFSGGEKLAAEVARFVGAVNKVGKVTNTIDLDRCVSDRAGGCVVAISPREFADVEAELKPAAAAHRSVKFVVLAAGRVALRTKAGAEGTVQALLNAAVRNAREAAAAVGQRGELLLLLRRAPADGLGAGSYTLSVGYPRTPGALALADVDALLATGKRAAAVLAPPQAKDASAADADAAAPLTPPASAGGGADGDADGDAAATAAAAGGGDGGSGGSGSSGDDAPAARVSGATVRSRDTTAQAGADLAEALLARDDALADHASALFGRGELYVATAAAATKRAKWERAQADKARRQAAKEAADAAAAAAAEEEGEGEEDDADADEPLTPDERKARRQRLKAEHAAAQADAEAAALELTAEEKEERARARREQMAREEAESMPQMAEEGEEEGGGGAGARGQEGGEEYVDLDDDDGVDHEHEEL